MGSTIQREATIEEAMKLGLTRDEFEMLKNNLGRTPNYAETIIYSTFWSEQSSYKIAENLLKKISNAHQNIRSIDIGEELSCELRIETLDKALDKKDQDTYKRAKVIAQINLLRFGNLKNVGTQKALIEFTKQISDSANESGIPVVEGDLFFDDSFNDNSIVNTFSVGIKDTHKSTSSNGVEEFETNNDFDAEKTLKLIGDQLELKVSELRVEKDAQTINYFHKDKLIAQLPAASQAKGVGKIENGKEVSEPAYFKENKSFDINDVKEPDDLKEVATFLLKHPNIASRRWVNNQFNSMKRTGANISKAITDAGITDIKDSNRAIALTIGGNSRYVKADPEIGTSIAIAEAARNIVCSGGNPIAIATCLNFAHLNNDESQWLFKNAVKGISAASEKFKTPVVSNNVAFYNHSEVDGENVSISPTPTIGMVGLLADKNKVMSLDFKHKGDLIFILGEAIECIASSEYLSSYHGIKESPAPYFNIDKEYEMQEVIKSLIKKDLINAAHDCSKDGIYVALTEMAIPNELGFDIVTDAEIREDAFLFGEATGRVLVGVNEESEDDFIEYMITAGVNFTLLGHVTQGKMVVDDEHYGFIQAAKKSYNSALESLIN